MSQYPMWIYGRYMYGYPNIKKNNTEVRLVLEDDGLVIYNILHNEFLFKIPYEDIENVSLDIKNEWDGWKMMEGLLIASPIGMLLHGKRDENLFGVIVKRMDKNGNSIIIPVIFKDVQKPLLLKEELDLRLNKERGINI